MTGDSARPDTESKGRRRLRSEWKSETTWRRHEIAGRLEKLQQGLDGKRFKELLARVEKVLDEARLPLTVRKKLEASITLERGTPEPGESEKKDE